MKRSLMMITTISASALVLASCQDQNGQPNNTASGILLGTMAGAATGILATDKGNKTQAAIIGGAMGAMIGGGIGNQLDEQEKALRNQLAGSGALIQNTGNKLIVTLPEAITFPVDGTAVKPSLMPTLASLANNLNQYPNTIVQVVGHTDSTGAESYNMDLSQRRAQSVASILRNNGVPNSRLQVFGMGETAPIASNSTPAGRQQNRRVEINIIPISQ